MHIAQSPIASRPTKLQPETARPEKAKWRSRLISFGSAALVVALLGLHFSERWHRAQSMPLADRHNYEQTYAYSLSILGGNGFHNLAVPPTPEGKPLERFLAKESDRVTPEQFQAFLANPGPANYDADAGEHNYWASSRILDQYVVAGLWRLFGIRWQAVFLFAAAMSTLSCFFVFLIARRIGGSYWIGLIAGVLYFASPLTGYLETWSLRDASPLWFAAAGFCVLFCVVDPVRSTARRIAASAALGVVAMIGIGWRPDVLLLVLYIGFSLLVLSFARRLPWTLIAASVAVYGLAAIGCHAAIFALSSERELDSQNGFQNAVYADFSRANLLEIENSFQIQRCDRATLFLTREYEHTQNPDAAPLPYKGHGFSQICRSIFLQELRYNAFRLVQSFPRVYWKSLAGLMVPGAFETQNAEQLRQGRLPGMERVYRAVLDPISGALPWLFLLGLAVVTTVGQARPQAFILGGLSVVQSVALLLVLPEQKHCGILILPMAVLGAIGIRSLAAILRPATWKGLLQSANGGRNPGTWRSIRQNPIAAGAAACVAIYGLAMLVSYEVSVHERRTLIAAIQEVARTSVPAPETLRGDKVFSIERLPGESPDPTGYLLKISAGSNPGEIVCRHIHFPQDWCWPRALETAHRLRQNREQFFFVTCEQGERFGDPRPYSCSAFLTGDAKIESCRRVDLKHWSRLPVSTVFYDGQNSPGSPRSCENNSVMRWANWPVLRSFSDDWQVMQAYARKSLFVGPQPIAPLSRPIEHLAACNGGKESWEIAINDGRKFEPAELSYWAPREWSLLASGDFNGDGMTDMIVRATDGSWWLGLANGNSIAFRSCPIDLPNAPIDYLGAGDFNGDDIDDLAVRFADGQWWIGLSDGQGFKFRPWGRWTAPISPRNIRIADFNGDGRADIGGFDTKSGQWLVSQSDGETFSTRVWGTFEPSVPWQHILAADFSGKGRTDVAAWNPATGDWMLGQSDGHRFNCRAAGKWTVDANWQYVSTGRFGQDARQGIVGLDKKSGRLAIATLDAVISAAPQFTTRLLPSHPALEGGIYAGCFNGDARDNLAGWTRSGEIWLGILDGNSIRYEKRGQWPAAAHLTDARVISFWREPSAAAAPVAVADRPRVSEN
ncbi:MAG TPA: FG-GAP-like repeat-containing protein [Pirellulales bacterium]|nr:FG-GAP-like repeat-containing protein [Pirellulales bacterium]